MRKRRLLSIAKDKPRRVYQTYAQDDFSELAARKRTALLEALQHGHQMTAWHKRPNDPAGRWNNFCGDCNLAIVVCTEAPHDFPDIYGPALTTACAKGRS